VKICEGIKLATGPVYGVRELAPAFANPATCESGVLPLHSKIALAVCHPISEFREPKSDFPANQGKNPSNQG